MLRITDFRYKKLKNAHELQNARAGAHARARIRKKIAVHLWEYDKSSHAKFQVSISIRG